jgi:hypothetical protein
LAILLASDYNLDIFKVFLNQLTTIIDIFSKRYRHGRDRIIVKTRKSMILFDRNLKLIALRIRQKKFEDTKEVTRSNN